MTPGNAKKRDELPWLPYWSSDRVIINAHNFGGPSWTPANITTQLWIDFADQSTLFDATSGGSAVANGGGIARAEDKSGNARHFTQGTSGARPAWSGGRASFDGGDFLTSTSANSTWTFLHSGPSTVFLVVKSGVTSNPSATYSWFGNNGSSSANRGIHARYDNRNILGMTNTYAFSVTNAGGQSSADQLNAGSTLVQSEYANILTAGTNQLYSLLFDPTNATASLRAKIGVNGGSQAGNNVKTGNTSTNDPTFALQLGTSGNNVLPLVGDFCELIILNSLASTDTRQTVEGYLAHKWALTASLPSDHPYKTVAP